MTKLMTTAVAAAAVAFCSAEVPADAKLTVHPVEVANPGFEDGTAGWALPANAAVDSDVAHSGAASASLAVADPKTDDIFIRRKIPVADGGAIYRASCFVKTEDVKPVKGKRDANGAGFLLEWADRDGKWLSGGCTEVCGQFGTKDWTRVGDDYIRAPENAAYANVYLTVCGAGKAWFDDFTLSVLESEIEMKEPAADVTLDCNTPRFSWEGLRHADVYTVDLSEDKSFPVGATRSYVVENATSFQLREPLKPGTWFWRVRAAGANHTSPRAFTQTAPEGRDCLPPEIRTPARRVLSADEPFAVEVLDDGAKPPRVTFGKVVGTCGRRGKGDVYVVTFAPPAGGWAPGLTARKMTATDAAGNVAQRPFCLLNAPKPANAVTVDARGDYVQGGRRIFPLGIYSVKPEYFREVRDAGFDAVHSYDWEDSSDDAACRAWLDACWATDGLRAFVGFDRGKSANKSAKGTKGVIQGNYAHLARRVAAIADHPGLFCWYLFDEPEHSSQYVSPRRLGDCADFIRALDPYHPIAVSTFGNYAYRRSWDSHWTQAYGNPAAVVKQIDKHRQALKGDSPVTLLVGCNDDPQTMAIRRDGTKPDPAKFERDYDYLRACAFLGVVKECNGVFWWWFARECPLYYSASQCPAAWANLVSIVKELGALRPLVTAPGQAETGTAVDGDCKVEWWRKVVNGRPVLVAVNTGTSPATVTIKGRRHSFRRYEVKVEK